MNNVRHLTVGENFDAVKFVDIRKDFPEIVDSIDFKGIDSIGWLNRNHLSKPAIMVTTNFLENSRLQKIDNSTVETNTAFPKYIDISLPGSKKHVYVRITDNRQLELVAGWEYSTYVYEAPRRNVGHFGNIVDSMSQKDLKLVYNVYGLQSEFEDAFVDIVSDAGYICIDYRKIPCFDLKSDFNINDVKISPIPAGVEIPMFMFVNVHGSVRLFNITDWDIFNILYDFTDDVLGYATPEELNNFFTMNILQKTLLEREPDTVEDILSGLKYQLPYEGMTCLQVAENEFMRNFIDSRFILTSNFYNLTAYSVIPEFDLTNCNVVYNSVTDYSNLEGVIFAYMQIDDDSLVLSNYIIKIEDDRDYEVAQSLKDYIKFYFDVNSIKQLMYTKHVENSVKEEVEIESIKKSEEILLEKQPVSTSLNPTSKLSCLGDALFNYMQDRDNVSNTIRVTMKSHDYKVPIKIIDENTFTMIVLPKNCTGDYMTKFNLSCGATSKVTYTIDTLRELLKEANVKNINTRLLLEINGSLIFIMVEPGYNNKKSVLDSLLIILQSDFIEFGKCYRFTVYDTDKVIPIPAV